MLEIIFLFAAVLFFVCALRDGIAIGSTVLFERKQSKSTVSWMASITDTILYGLLVFIEYAIMLVIMSYNLGLFFIIIGGLMVSRFVFYPMTMKGGSMPATCH
eukprot:135892_1